MLCKNLNIVYKFNFKTFIYMYYQNILFLNASFFSKIWRFKILVILFPFFKILKQKTRSVSNKNSKMVIVRARYHLLCLRCCIFWAQLIMRFYYTNFCSKLVSRIHINLFNFLSFHLISQKPLSLNVVFDAYALFRLYLLLSSSDYCQCPKSAAFHIKL